MEKHFVLFLVVIAVCLFFARAVDHGKSKKTCIYFITIILTLFSGLRTWWFGDLIKYYTLYRSCNGTDGYMVVFQEFSNIGIRIFFFISGHLGISYDVCIFLIAAFSAITLGYVVFKYSPSPYWSYLIYIAMGFYLFTYSGLKQTIAMGFLLLAADGIFEKKPGKFLLWTIVASFFHAPAFIFLPAYIISMQRYNQRYVLILAFATVCVFVFRDQIVGIVSEAYYEDETRFSADGQIGGRTLMMVFILMLAAFLRPLRHGDSIYSKVYNLMVVAVLIQYFSMYNNVFTRLADYYFQFVVLFMPLMLESGSHQLRTNPNPSYRIRCYDKRIYMFLGFAVTLFAIWFYKNTIDSSSGLLSAYKFFWEIDPYSLYGT